MVVALVVDVLYSVLVVLSVLYVVTVSFVVNLDVAKVVVVLVLVL